MNVSEKQYEKYIKPFSDKIFELKDITNIDEILVGDVIVNIANNEFEFDTLRKIILSLTPIQKKFFKRKGLEKELDVLIKFFEENI